MKTHELRGLQVRESGMRTSPDQTAFVRGFTASSGGPPTHPQVSITQFQVLLHKAFFLQLAMPLQNKFQTKLCM